MTAERWVRWDQDQFDPERLKQVAHNQLERSKRAARAMVAECGLTPEQVRARALELSPPEREVLQSTDIGQRRVDSSSGAAPGRDDPLPGARLEDLCPAGNHDAHHAPRRLKFGPREGEDA